jgi:hypothetical protein
LSHIHTAAELNSHKRFLPRIEILLPHHRRLDPAAPCRTRLSPRAPFQDALTGGQWHAKRLLDFWVYTSPANRLSAFSATLPRRGNAGSLLADLLTGSTNGNKGTTA